MKLLFLLAALAAVARFAAEAGAADPPKKRPMTVNDLFQLRRVGDPQISPDGTRVAYTVGKVDLEANKIVTSIWLADADGKAPPRQITSSGKRDAHPRWSPDGTKLLFESNRSGATQLYVLDLKAGGEAKQLTTISTGAEQGIWSPDGKLVAFASAVNPAHSALPFAESDAKNKAEAEAAEKSPVKARVFTKLFFRHWDSYVDGKRQHLFVCDAEGKECRDATPGDRDAVPTSSTFSSGRDFTFTPDSKHLVFTAPPAEGEAWTTNYDLCRVSVTNTATTWEVLTKDNPAADSGPQFSPDGTKLAWRRQAKPGYEADKWELAVVDVKPDGMWAGMPKDLTAGDAMSVNEFCWSADRLTFVADRKGAAVPFMVDLDGRVGEGISYKGSGSTTERESASALSCSTDGRWWAHSQAAMTRPPQVFVHGFPSRSDGGVTNYTGHLSHANDALLDELDLPEPESVEVPVEGGVDMQMWLLKPPGFDAAKKWPVVYLVHGGPQSAWEDGWSNRWNPQVWAARGYIVAMPNPRGSTGFGQKFTDEISRDWGGKCYRDLVAGLDHVEKLPYVDKERIASAGGSFGGYMMNWFAVNDIAPRFRCLVTHCSVWNFESMWGTTEELWFDEYDHGGLPWEVPGKYREFSPHTRAGELGKHKTPMLVIHNDLDFRCPIGQGHELFTALQRQGVPSRMVNFPDEGHWVLKPQNSKRWHEEVFGWLEKWAPSGGR